MIQEIIQKMCVKAGIAVASTLLVLGMLTAPARASAKHSVESAESYAKDFIDSLVTTASRKGQTVAEQRVGVVRLVEENVDLQWAAKFVLGKYWRSLSSEQQTDFTNLYHDYLMHTYAPKFQGYAGESADVDFVEYVDENDYSVECVFYSKSGDETLVNLIVHYDETEERFMIREVVVEGVGLLNTQRADFTASISNVGYADFLNQMVEKIAALKEQNTDLTTRAKSKAGGAGNTRKAQ